MIPPAALRSGADSSPLTRGEYSLLGWALLIALIVRIYVAAATCVISVDGVEYIRAAGILKAGGIKAAAEHFYPPGYPAAIVCAEVFVEDPERAGQIASLFFGLLLVIVVYRFVREIFGRRAAAIAVLIVATQHQLAKYAVQVRAESMFLALQLTALWLALRVSRGGHWVYSPLCGLAAAGAFYARPEEGVILALFCTAWIAIELVRGKKSPALMIAAPVICAGLFAGCVSPFVVAVQEHRAVGRETKPLGIHVSRKRDLGADAIRENLDRNGKDEQAFTPAVTERSQPDEEALEKDIPRGISGRIGVYFRRIVRLVRKFGVALHLFCGLFLLIGIFYRRAIPRDRATEIALGIFALAMVAVFAIVLPSHRHTVQLIAPLLGFAAAGICEIAALSARRLQADAAAKRAAFSAGLVVTMITVFYLAETVKPRRIEHIALRRAGCYLESFGPGVKVLTPEAPLVFYANAHWVLDPARDEYEKRGRFTRFSERLERGIAGGAEYLALEMNVLQESNKNPLPLPEVRGEVRKKLESDARLKLEIEFPPHPWFPKGDRVRIYRIISKKGF